MPHTYTNGIVTFYEDAWPEPSRRPSPGGRGLAQAVVLIHGHSLDLHMWERQVPALVAAGYRVVRYDVRGHGRSMIPPDGYTWENASADLGDLLDRLNVESPAGESLRLDAAHVVGLSMGGGIALQFALDFPRRVLSLTLVDSTLPGFTYGAEFARDIEELVQAVRTDGPRAAFERLWLSHPLFDGIRRYPDRFTDLRETVLNYAAADYREGAIPAGYQPTLADRLSEIAAPALVIVGEDDIADFRLIADLLAANLPRARPYGRPYGRKLVLPDCGHLPPLEQPEAFNEALIAFLRGVSPAPS